MEQQLGTFFAKKNETAGFRSMAFKTALQLARASLRMSVKPESPYGVACCCTDMLHLSLNAFTSFITLGVYVLPLMHLAMPL